MMRIVWLLLEEPLYEDDEPTVTFHEEEPEDWRGQKKQIVYTEVDTSELAN